MDYMKGDYNSLTWECAKRPIGSLLAWELVKGWIGTVQMVKNKKGVDEADDLVHV
jgi:hypothetical protein